MKTIKFFAVALAALTIASCSKEEIGGSNNSMGGNELNTPTYATFKFNIGGASSRADVDNPYNPSENPENDNADQAIETLQLLIFNATTGKLEHNSLLAPNKTSKTVLLTAGKKKIFFVANSAPLNEYTNDIDPTVFKEGTLSDFYNKNFSAGKPQQLVKDADQATVDRTFNFSKLYTFANAGANTGLPMSNTNEVTYTLKAGVSEADAQSQAPSSTGESDVNNFSVKLYYMVAKARLILATGVESAGDDVNPAISDVKYAVRNLARCTNYIQNVPTTDNPQSYYYGTSFSGKADFDKEFDYASNINAAASTTAGDYLYVPENNHSILLRGQSSYFAIKALFRPVVITDVAYDVNTKVAYTYKKLVNTDSGNYIYTTKNVQGIPAGTYFETVALFEKAAWIMANGVPFSDDKISEAEGMVADEVVPTDDVKRSGDYMSFTGGNSYYRLDLGAGTGADTKYGVLRSNKYDATINKITGPGFPTEGDLTTDPSDPVSAKTYINATIIAAEWNEIKQSADL